METLLASSGVKYLTSCFYISKAPVLLSKESKDVTSKLQSEPAKALASQHGRIFLVFIHG